MKKRHTGAVNFAPSDIVVPLAVVFVNIIIILFPKETISASKEGLSLWFMNVLPSLLPFIIGANILTSLGAVNFIGTLLEPLMRPLFNVPGCGGFALAMGLTSGYPMGAKVVSELRKNNDVNKVEAQRLIAFANNSGPLFILGAVASGMLENIFAGYFILGVHYISALAVGVLFRYYKKGSYAVGTPTAKKNIFRRAYRSMQDARLKNGGPIGAVLGQSVFMAMETVLQIGGFIILFCVIVKAVDIIGFFDVLLGIFPTSNGNIVKGLFTGIIEMTNGCKAISGTGSGADSGSIREAIIFLLAVVSFGGFSIHAQALSFMSKTDINPLIYLLSKAVHALIAVILGIIIYPLFKNTIENGYFMETSAGFKFSDNILNHLLSSIMYFGIAIFILLVGIILANGILYFLTGKK